MEIERMLLLVLAVVAAIIITILAYRIAAPSQSIYGTRVQVLDGINKYAEKCSMMHGNGDCFVIGIENEDEITRSDVSKLSDDFVLSEDISPGKHKLKFYKSGNEIDISVVS